VQINLRVIALVGLGETELSAEKWRQLGGALVRSLRNTTALAVGFDLGESAKFFVEGAALGAIPDYTLKSSKPQSLTSQLLLRNTELNTLDLANINVAAEAVGITRHLVNTPANLLYPETLVDFIKSIDLPKTVSVDVWDVKKLEKERCAGILAVGHGSAREPRLIRVTYSPRVANSKLALVGKGITFDTGGLSLKPAAGMVGMKYDMAGAATVFASLLAIAKLDLAIEVTAWLCVAENMPSGSAARPNDVITMRNGKTVEILNTDAEGRLVLSDGLILASESQPDLIVDVATLTGAATVALGKRFAGIMGNQAGVTKLEAAFAASGETAWAMPLPEELRELLDTPIADVANAKIGNTAGGMLLGAHFLKEFIGKTLEGDEIAWGHIDFAGPANNDGSAHGYTPKGATGFGVRTLVKLAERLADEQTIAE
jgi:leucyl aminopeptidase